MGVITLPHGSDNVIIIDNVITKIVITVIIHGQAGGTGPQNTNWSQRLLLTKKKRRQAKKSKYEFVYELEIRNRSQIRIRIYVLPSKYELVH